MVHNLKLSVFVLFAIFLFGSALTVHQKLDQGHLTESQKHQTMKLVHQKFSSIMHSAEKPAIGGIDMNGPFGAFFTWMMADKVILKSIMNSTPLPLKSAEKIKKYLIKHPQVIESFIPAQDDFSKCIKNLTPKQKQKYYGIILAEFDFVNMFAQSGNAGNLGNDKTTDMAKKALADKELGPILMNCAVGTQK